MARYRLLKGSFTHGQRDGRKTYKATDPENNVVEAEENLTALAPGKFERLNEDDEEPYYRAPNRTSTAKQGEGKAEGKESEGKTTNPGAVSGPNPAAPAKKKQSIEDTYGNLDDQSVADLKEIATAEKIDLKGATTKADIVKAIKAHG